ncbi:MAG: hypothetical protein JW929_02540 [Anaerolineales bacterium]|nr:hypothetical protein [Anaerolineales bacterium]
MTNLENIRFIATNFSVLYGLRAVPIGMCLSYVFAEGAIEEFTPDLLIPILLIVLSVCAHIYYQRTYGRVEATKEFRREYSLLTFAVMAVAMAGVVFDTWNLIPVSVFAIAFALTMLWSQMWMVRQAGVKNPFLFPAGLVCIALVFLSAFLPLFGENTFGTFGWGGVNPAFLPLLGDKVFGAFHLRSSISFVYATVGVLYALYGVMEHFFMVRFLSPAAKEIQRQPV